MWFMTLHRKDGDRPMIEARNDWDLERVRVHNLAAAVLLEQAPAAPAGRAALTLIPGAGAALKPTLLALWEACSWPNTTRLGRRRCRSCAGGWDWWPAAGTGAGHG
jgi:hypothetical protein